MLNRLKRWPSESPQKLETSNTNADETDTSRGRRKILSNITFRMKKVCGQVSLAGFCDRTKRCLQKTRPFLLSGVPEKCVSLEKWASWSAADLSRESLLLPGSTPVPTNTLVARAKILRKSFERGRAGATEGQDQEGLPCGSWLRVFMCRRFDRWWGWCCWTAVASSQKVSRFVDALKMRGSYELVEKLWAQFVLFAGLVTIQVAWVLGEVLVCSVNLRSHFVSFQIYCDILL